MALQIKNANDTVSGSEHRIVFGGVLHGGGYIELVSDDVYAKRRITSRQARIQERSQRGKSRGVGFDAAAVEIGDGEEWCATIRRHNRKCRVDGSRLGMING